MKDLSIEEKTKELKRKYYREYYKKNKEKRLASNKKYWENKARKELI